MSVPNPSREILSELTSLNPDQQHEVLGFVRSLKLPAGAAGTSLLRFAGVIDRADLKEISDAIEEGCERISPDGW